MSKLYKVEYSTGFVANVPATVKTKYESISTYGVQAVLERAKRTNAYKREGGQIRAIITPAGERITQF